MDKEATTNKNMLTLVDLYLNDVYVDDSHFASRTRIETAINIAIIY